MRLVRGRTHGHNYFVGIKAEQFYQRGIGFEVGRINILLDAIVSSDAFRMFALQVSFEQDARNNFPARLQQPRRFGEFVIHHHHRRNPQ